MGTHYALRDFWEPPPRVWGLNWGDLNDYPFDCDQDRFFNVPACAGMTIEMINGVWIAAFWSLLGLWRTGGDPLFKKINPSESYLYSLQLFLSFSPGQGSGP